MEETGIELKVYLRIFQRWWWLLLMGAAGAAVAGPTNITQRAVGPEVFNVPGGSAFIKGSIDNVRTR